MPPKAKSKAKAKANDKAKPKRAALTLLQKKDIIEKVDRGRSQTSVGLEYGRNQSTIGTVLRQREKILKEVKTAAVGIVRIENPKVRDPLMNKMEHLLIQWLLDMMRKGGPLPSNLVRAKARHIFDGLKAQQVAQEADKRRQDGLPPLPPPPPRAVDDEDDEEDGSAFKASRGWLQRFKNRNELRNVKMTGEEDDPNAAIEDILEVGRLLHMDMDEAEVRAVINHDVADYSIPELEALAEMGREAEEEIPEFEKKLTSAEIKEVLKKWEDIQEFVQKHHPRKDALTSMDLFNDEAMLPLRKILESKVKQSKIEDFFAKAGTQRARESTSGPASPTPGPSGTQATSLRRSPRRPKPTAAVKRDAKGKAKAKQPAKRDMMADFIDSDSD